MHTQHFLVKTSTNLCKHVTIFAIYPLHCNWVNFIISMPPQQTRRTLHVGCHHDVVEDSIKNYDWVGTEMIT